MLKPIFKYRDKVVWMSPRGIKDAEIFEVYTDEDRNRIYYDVKVTDSKTRLTTFRIAEEDELRPR